MNEEIEGLDEIKELFKTVLGSEVIIKDNIENSKKSIFITFVSKLEQTAHTEDQIFNISGIDLNNVNDGLWEVLEYLFKFTYGEPATELIWWYLFSRLTPEGEIIPYEEDNKEYIFKTPDDLWNYVNFHIPIEEEDDDVDE